MTTTTNGIPVVCSKCNIVQQLTTDCCIASIHLAGKPMQFLLSPDHVDTAYIGRLSALSTFPHICICCCGDCLCGGLEHTCHLIAGNAHSQDFTLICRCHGISLAGRSFDRGLALLIPLIFYRYAVRRFEYCCQCSSDYRCSFDLQRTSQTFHCTFCLCLQHS